MSYSYSSGGHPTYPYTSAGYSAGPTVPQYTQSQINAYYQQYQCYPQEPFTIVPDAAYAQPVQHVVVPSSGYAVAGSTQGYYAQGVGSSSSQDPNRLAPPQDDEFLRRRRSQKADRRSRSSSRTRTWTCNEPDCTSTANFTRLADLQRHQATVHGNALPEFPCTVPRCNRVADKGFTRRDHLVEHLRNFHHLDIPKRRPGERSANPLGLPGYYQGS